MGMQMRELGGSISGAGNSNGRESGRWQGVSGEATDDTATLLEQALQRLKQQDRLLAFFEQKWMSAQKDVQLLMDSHDRTKDRLARLTEHAKHLYRAAIHDEVTGLLNRRMLMNRLSHAIVQAERGGKKIGVIFLDVPDFKRITEQHERSVADQALQQLARRLESCVRGGDSVGRYGDDKFVMLLPEIQRPRNVEPVLDKIRAKLIAPYLVGDRALRFSADVGVAIYPNDARHPHELIKKADAAMYRAKQKPGAHIQGS